MAEWLIAPVLKTGERASVPGVRIPLYPPLLQQRTFSEPQSRGENPSFRGPLRLYLMTADLVKTAKMLSLAPMFSKAGDLGILVHSFIVMPCQALRWLARFELDVLNSTGERTRRRILLLWRLLRSEFMASKPPSPKRASVKKPAHSKIIQMRRSARESQSCMDNWGSVPPTQRRKHRPQIRVGQAGR
jgi:hypothetical protein